MTLEEAVAFYGSKAALAKKLSIQRSTVSMWESRGKIPIGRQYEIEVDSQGKLRAAPGESLSRDSNADPSADS